MGHLWMNITYISARTRDMPFQTFRPGSGNAGRFLGTEVAIPEPLLRLLVVILVIMCPLGLHARPAAPAASDHSTTVEAIRKTIAAETAALEKLRATASGLAPLEKSVRTEVAAIRLQNSAHGNLLLLSQTSIDDLQTALAANRTILDKVRAQLASMHAHIEPLQARYAQTGDQLDLNKNQLTDLKSAPRTTDTTRLRSALMDLIHVITEKRSVLGKMLRIYNDAVDQYTGVQKELLDLQRRFDETIRIRKANALYGRNKIFFSPITAAALHTEWEKLRQTPARLKTIPLFHGAQGVVYLLILIAVGLLCWRTTRSFRNIERRLESPEKIWRKRLLFVVRRCLVYIGLLLVLLAFRFRQLVPVFGNANGLVTDLLWILLITRWAVSFAEMPDRAHAAWPFCLAPEVSVQRAIRPLGGAAMAYTLLSWSIGAESGLLIILCLLLEVGLVIGCLRVSGGRAFAVSSEMSRLEKGKRIGLAAACHGVVWTGVILEFMGFYVLAPTWYADAAKTIVIVLWFLLLNHAIAEWRAGLQRAREADDRHRLTGWMVFLIGRIALVIFGITAVLLAWGGDETVFRLIYRGLNAPLTIGKVTVDLLGGIYAVVVLLFTAGLVKVGRHVMQDRLFRGTPLEDGLKDSIIAIAGYAFWLIGIMIALQIVGVSTASLAVVFGALGIGLGFGLQNIFNNFISGLILLFERPIQVGDAIEINGIWGQVKKINVRSTLVQTYDNASLIIPNSEFISSQVTNWSFKDLRVRRIITVGVAYGSDTHLVRDTLMEIAQNQQKVLKYPVPSVLFHDFGDSALVFKLRIWTDVDSMLDVETGIRFEIDRLFRERNIEISFPQRDIHIRSVEGENPLSIRRTEPSTAENHNVSTRFPNRQD
jgi:potassium-dependent mechanosensitive channel